MGPLLNALDPRFNLHLRGDRLAEVYKIRKPTKRDEAISVEEFDKDGMLTGQVFSRRKDGDADLAQWNDIYDSMPDAGLEEFIA